MDITMCANSDKCPLAKFCLRSIVSNRVTADKWQSWSNFHIGDREGCENFIPTKEYKDGISNKNRR